MDFNNIFGRSPLDGDVLPFRKKHVVGREAFDSNHDIEEDETEHRKPLDLSDMNEEELRIVVDHPAIHPDVRRYAKLELRLNELLAFGNRKGWDGKPIPIDGPTSRRLEHEILEVDKKQRHIYYTAIPDELKWRRPSLQQR